MTGVDLARTFSLTSSRTFIRDLQPSQYVEAIYAIRNGQLGWTKAGKPYLKCLLSDRSGQTPGRMWNATEDLFKSLPSNGFVWIQGHSQPYEGQIQIIIQQIQPAEPTPEELTELMPSSEQDPDQMFAELRTLLDTLQTLALRALVDQYLMDDDLMSQFKQAPAAKVMHHAYLGGLLEHTLNLLRLANLICPLYPNLNRDLVLTGLFLHDLAKCCELTWDRGFDRSDDGQLIGHVARGAIWLQRKAEDCRALGHPISDPLLMVLQHIILSHHGEPEFGAAVRPATPEAIAVNLLDNLDAKLNMALTAARSPQSPSADNEEMGGNFTEKIYALDTRLYRPDPTKL